MTLPAPNLDNLRFQTDLVDEARKRIAQYCPEWTDYNVSDPGITLLELFAWLTESMIYRLNRVPEKNYIKFLDLLGMQRLPASSARANLTFWLSTPLPIGNDENLEVFVPQGIEVQSSSVDSEEPVVFSIDRARRITAPNMTYLQRGKEVHKNYLSRLGIETFYPFDTVHPKNGDAFYIGFDPKQDLSGYTMRLTFTCEPVEAVGVRREDPPWVWECSTGTGEWQVVPLSEFHGEKDTTGGLNNPTGSLVIYLPLNFQPDEVNGRHANWIRCRLEQRSPSQGMYTESPRVSGVAAHTIGATAPASHAQVIRMEELAMSTGDSGQEIKLAHAPILDLQDGETLLVEEFHHGENVLVPWTAVESFSNSSQYDRHFTIDYASGQIRLGPSVRQANGAVQQYGRVPEHGRRMVFKQYRYGGGARGNLPPNTVQTMTSSIPYVARVTNLTRSSGGQDQETLEEVKLRARREMQAQKRAVTAQDFEQAALNFSRYAARVRCVTPGISGHEGGTEVGVVKLLVVPAVADSLQAGDISRLQLNEEYIRTLGKNLDQLRLLTTHVQINEPAYVGVQVKARVVADEFSSPEAARVRVEQHLANFLNPLVVYPGQEEKDQLLEKGWSGWPFGRSLFAAEVYALIQRVPGIKYVLDVEISSRPVEPRLEDQAQNARPTLTPLTERLLRVPARSLLVSLEHEINVIAISEFNEEAELK